MSNRQRITVRHTASQEIRDTIERVIQTREIRGEPTEVVLYQNNWFRVIRRGRGVFIYNNRPIPSLAA